MSDVAAGSAAPDFVLRDQRGNEVRLSDYAGRTVVLYFYPKADTSGCTREACDFRDALPDFSAVKADVLGISPDLPKAQLRFADKYDLPFRLLSDPDKAACQAYGVWVQKSMYGRSYMGVERSTFVIGGDGTVAAAFRKVSVPGHVDDVLKAVRGLGS